MAQVAVPPHDGGDATPPAEDLELVVEPAPGVPTPVPPPDPVRAPPTPATAEAAEAADAFVMPADPTSAPYGLDVLPRTTYESEVRAGEGQRPEGSTSPAAELEPMTPEQAHAAAHAEGLVLLPAENPTGFKGVNLGSTVSRPFVAKMWNGSRVDTLGTFATAEEAALAVARALGPEGVAAALQAASQEAPPMTAAEALAQAAAEGLTLQRADSAAGYKHVRLGDNVSKPFQACPWNVGRPKSLGSFATPEEAALAVARYNKLERPPPPTLPLHQTVDAERARARMALGLAPDGKFAPPARSRGGGGGGGGGGRDRKPAVPRNKPTALRKRITYDREFKLKVVKEALRLPLGRRIRPTCSKYPAIEPCQLRKWIRALQHEARTATTRSSEESDPRTPSSPGRPRPSSNWAERRCAASSTARRTSSSSSS